MLWKTKNYIFFSETTTILAKGLWFFIQLLFCFLYINYNCKLGQYSFVSDVSNFVFC